MKRFIACVAAALVAQSCSVNAPDPKKYCVATEATPIAEWTLEAGEKVMPVLNALGAPGDGYERIIAGQRHDLGVVKAELLEKTDEPIPFPDKGVFEDNLSEVIFVRNFNASFDRTFRDSYRLECVFPAGTRRMEVRTKDGVVVQDARFPRRYGLKYADREIDLRPFPVGDVELTVVAYGKRNAVIGSREFVVRKDDPSSETLANGQKDTFRYRVEGNEIVLERFFGYAEDDENAVTYEPDFNRYVIGGSGGYSYAAGIKPDMSKGSIDDIPLTLRVMRDGRELASFDLRHFELTPFWGEECRIVEYPNAVVVLCTPSFESAPRIVIYNKRTNAMYDVWTLLRDNGIDDYHDCFAVSVGKDILITEVPFRFDRSEKPFETYVVDIETDAVSRDRSSPRN